MKSLPTAPTDTFVTKQDSTTGQDALGKPRVYLETYGCQMNVSDSELMEGILRDAGYGTADDPAHADVILVNTCAVRERAEERVFGRIGELTQYKHANPGVIIGVTGCMAEHLREGIPARAKAVDIVVGPDAYRNLPALIDGHIDRASLSRRASQSHRASQSRRSSQSRRASLDVRLDRAENYIGLDPVRRASSTGWVTIMRGCDRFCTFCIVPYTRGREKCVPPDEILRQVRGLAEIGYREVTLLGQTVNSYRYDGTDFADLLRRVAAVDGIDRIRFTSPHPAEFTEKVIAAMAETPEVCPYVHLPVQSGDDEMLRRMRRDYTVDEYRMIVENLRSAIPDVALSTDIIVGFCGETEEQFERTYRLMKEMRYDFAFMFMYSAREGTVAARSLPDDVSEEDKGRRLRAIIDQQEAISEDVFKAQVGTVVDVLIEGPAKKTDEHSYGRAADFKAVVVRGEFARNTIVRTRIHRSTAHTLFGDPI